jgi:hypothetical protein
MREVLTARIDYSDFHSKTMEIGTNYYDAMNGFGECSIVPPEDPTSRRTG